MITQKVRVVKVTLQHSTSIAGIAMALLVLCAALCLTARAAGRYIAFEPSNGDGLSIVEVASGTVTRLTNVRSSYPAWRP